MRPRCLLVYDVLWVLSRYQYLAEAKIIKHRLSPLRLAPLKMPGSSKAYRGNLIGDIVNKAQTRASATLRGMRDHGALPRVFLTRDNSRLVMPRLSLEAVSKAVDRSIVRSGLSWRPADEQMIDSQLWVRHGARSLFDAEFHAVGRMPSFDQVWAWLSEVICVLRAKEHAVVLGEHDKHPRNRVDVQVQERIDPFGSWRTHDDNATLHALFNGFPSLAEAMAPETVVVVDSVLPRHEFEISLRTTRKSIRGQRCCPDCCRSFRSGTYVRLNA
jgi:hypothetical protein